MHRVVLPWGTSSTSKSKQLVEKQIINHSISVENFLDILNNLCESIDNLIETFRVQLKRVENVYEQKEKPSLQKDYVLLLQSIQELVATANIKDDDQNKKFKKIEKKINDLSESLENYGIKIIDGKITDLN